jgi:hypothetical protein
MSMNTSGETAEQIMHVAIEGSEVCARLAGDAAKETIAIIYAMLKDSKTQSTGKKKLIDMLKSGKELKIFSIQKNQLEKFIEEAKRYGVSYCTLLDKNDTSPKSIVDLLVKSEDASRVNRIVERYKLLIKEEPKENEKEKGRNTENKDGVSKDFLLKEENQSKNYSMIKKELDDGKVSVVDSLKAIKNERITKASEEKAVIKEQVLSK